MSDDDEGQPGLQEATTAVLAENDPFLVKNITQKRKTFIAQPKHMIF